MKNSETRITLCVAGLNRRIGELLAGTDAADPRGSGADLAAAAGLVAAFIARRDTDPHAVVRARAALGAAFFHLLRAHRHGLVSAHERAELQCRMAAIEARLVALTPCVRDAGGDDARRTDPVAAAILPVS
ncbi:MAG: hypothetical protein IT495_08935 [Gammaproteobacteria bacterium]|nr:hypothetical protein [Gammaproteobacteria bacterium]